MTSRVPDVIEGYTIAKGRSCTPVGKAARDRSKLRATIQEAIIACGLRNGATISFHHHLRNGDDVVRQVMDAVAGLGIRGIRVAASSLFPVHASTLPYIRNGTISGITTSYVSGPVAEAIANGELETPAVLQTHGGRARAIESGELAIDIAFIAAPAADDYGNLNGIDGPSACGPLGYAMVDARHARHVVAITDTLRPFPLARADIGQDLVDFVVPVPSIGDPLHIVSGSTRITTDPECLAIADMVALVIQASGLLVDGFSFQTGAGGTSLAVAASLARIMERDNIVGSFAAGGITESLVAMMHAGLFRALFDVQCFDLAAVESYRCDGAHRAMSASQYANPNSRGAVVNRLDAMILGAGEVDLDFNVNVTAVGGGRIIGGSGGHADTAAGAKLAIVTTRLTSGRNPKIVDSVECITTPGDTIDIVVTEAGCAVNPLRPDLCTKLAAANIPVLDIRDLRNLAARKAGREQSPMDDAAGRRIVAVVEYRDGSVIDIVRQRRGSD